ncbi:hypothetical protein [Mycobacterium sp. IDR2000157661]|uniref:hypothetical protein n=1 Tax=Mycobacterium sp. IDR2000157661 TaxID=2867005 RepID=UPI001EEBD3A6|nr:hypothetical protein [Mycobacterium sp. IDR2000157661]ULE32601.1 hypothetical protein K3G64_21295 [Mycobacterium sp. IDR2000157661]
MSPSQHRWWAAATLTAVLTGSQLLPASATAEPVTAPTTEEQAAPAPDVLHNVIYRARADGTSRGAVVAYKIDDTNVNSEQPTLLPGRTFEVNTVLDDPTLAGIEVSIDWPYGSNLHCEILVDDQVVAKADQFIAPRLLRPKDDPRYGTLQCGATLNTDAAVPPPVDPAATAPEPVAAPAADPAVVPPA